MIQFNLLPDVKLEFVKARHLKHLVITVAAVATIAAIGIVLILVLIVDVWQKKSLSDVNNDISRYTNQVKSTPNLNKILTVQNQLNSLPSLYSSRPVVSRLFPSGSGSSQAPGYIAQLTPDGVDISSIDMDFTQNTIQITGTAGTIADINQYVDVLKFATYKDANSSGSDSTKAFSNVVLSSYSIGTASTGGSSGSSSQPTYSISADFDPKIFSSKSNITINVPSEISTRSVQEVPTVLFNQPTTSTSTNSGNTSQ